MMARVAFGLRGMWLPLFFQLMSNICFVCFDLHVKFRNVQELTMDQVRLASCVRGPGDWTDARRHDTPIQEHAQHTSCKVSTLREIYSKASITDVVLAQVQPQKVWSGSFCTSHYTCQSLFGSSHTNLRSSCGQHS